MSCQKIFSQMSINPEPENDESTPLKTNNQNSLNLSISPIGKRLSLNTTLEDIDSAYYSRLKGSSPSINSIRSPSITSIRSPSKFTKKLSNLIDLLDSGHPGENDLLSCLFERNIFHVLQKILDHLKPKDYIKLFMVCKKWNQIVYDDLNHNIKRRLQLSHLKRIFLNKKENVKFSWLMNNSIEEIVEEKHFVIDQDREWILGEIENSRLKAASPEKKASSLLETKDFQLDNLKVYLFGIMNIP
ncbi:Regulator of G- signaling 22 [Brachionus plicatilis]|uniref:Regulator of G-signaling 22 n=1 Tax=Brachionus plicatilis TaxID=10195 RepID=A0A3M7P6D7_BRAPC|nr:Regulator of G- signaling 22 [Brachionus plicatilis]